MLILLFFSSLLSAATFQNSTLSFEYNEANWELIQPQKVEGKNSVDADMTGKTIITLQRRNADDKYRARFSVVVDSAAKAEPQKNETPLMAYTRYTQDFLKSQRFSILDQKKSTFGGTEATDTVLYQRDFGLKFRQLVFIRDKDAYLMTFTSRQKPFDSYVVEIESVLSSLRFKEVLPFKHAS